MLTSLGGSGRPSASLTVINCSRGGQVLRNISGSVWGKCGLCGGRNTPNIQDQFTRSRWNPSIIVVIITVNIVVVFIGAAGSHTSIQQSWASSGLHHAAGSANTDNPQDRSPRRNHRLDTGRSSHFRTTQGEKIYIPLQADKARQGAGEKKKRRRGGRRGLNEEKGGQKWR